MKKKQATPVNQKSEWDGFIAPVKDFFKGHSLAFYITICVVAISGTTYKGLSTFENIRIVEANAAAKAAEAQALVQREKIKADAIKETTEASMNPFALEAKKMNSCPPVSLTINSVDYNVGTTDAETDKNLSITVIENEGSIHKYNPEQRRLMTLAFYEGQRVGFPETIQAILLQETRAGAFGNRIGDVNLPIGKRSYGVMQMKVATARKVLKKHPEMVEQFFPARKKLKRVRDEEIIIRLIQNDTFAVRMAALNFVDHRKKSKSWSQSVVAYNTGQGAANRMSAFKEHVYYKHVIKRIIKEVRPFNSQLGLAGA